MTVRNLPGLLMITGTPSSQAAPLQITQVGGIDGNTFKIVDGAKNLGTYNNVNNVILRLAHRRVDVEVDLNGGRIPGNLLMSLGNGFIGVGQAPISLFSSVDGGRVGGSVSILGGNGREFINVGSKDGVDLLPVVIGGNLLANGRAAATALGDSLVLHGDELVGFGSEVRGTLRALNVDNVVIGNQNSDGTARVGGNVIVTVAGPHLNTSTSIFGQVDGSVVVNVPSGSAGFNLFNLEAQTLAIPSMIGGNLSVSFGPAGSGNLFLVQAAVGQMITSMVGGNVSLNSTNSGVGLASDFFVVNAHIAGSLSLNMGNGTNFVDSDEGVVGGNLTVVAGNGDNFFGFQFSLDGLALQVAGNASFILGNGNNEALFTNAPAGTLNWQSGNGDNLLVLGTGSTAANSVWNVNLRFGNGDDELILFAFAPPTQVLTGLVNMGGGDNLFDQDDWVISPFATIIV